MTIDTAMTVLDRDWDWEPPTRVSERSAEIQHLRERVWDLAVIRESWEDAFCASDGDVEKIRTVIGAAIQRGDLGLANRAINALEFHLDAGGGR